MISSKSPAGGSIVAEPVRFDITPQMRELRPVIQYVGMPTVRRFRENGHSVADTVWLMRRVLVDIRGGRM
ncbi:MAG: hypothetical protein AB7P21_29995 [Lautropia sp.]